MRPGVEPETWLTTGSNRFKNCVSSRISSCVPGRRMSQHLASVALEKHIGKSMFILYRSKTSPGMAPDPDSVREGICPGCCHHSKETLFRDGREFLFYFIFHVLWMQSRFREVKWTARLLIRFTEKLLLSPRSGGMRAATTAPAPPPPSRPQVTISVASAGSSRSMR